MGRSIVSIICGIAIAFLITQFMQGISIKLYPYPEGMDMTNPAALAGMPAGAFLLILAGYALAAFTGGLVATGISKILRQSFIVALVLMMANTANLMQIEHPVWFAIASSVIYFPFAWMGGKLGQRIRTKYF